LDGEEMKIDWTTVIIVGVLIIWLLFFDGFKVVVELVSGFIPAK
jgi:hypothetical protein